MVTSSSPRNNFATKMQQQPSSSSSKKQRRQRQTSSSSSTGLEIPAYGKGTPAGKGNKNSNGRNSAGGSNSARKPSTKNIHNLNLNLNGGTPRAVSTPPRQTPQKYSNLSGSRSASTPSPKIFAETKKTSAPTPASLPKPPSAWFNAAAASKTTLAPFSAQVVTALPSPVVMDSPKMRHPSDESMTSVLSDESSKSDTSTCFAEFAKLCLQGQQGGDMFASQHLKGLLKVH